MWDDHDPDLPAEAGHLGGDLLDPGHGDSQALDKVGVDNHLKREKCRLELKKKETHVPMLELLSEPNGAHGVLSAEDHLLWGQIYKYLSSVNYNQYVT